MVTVLEYVYADPLLLGLVMLNVLPCVIMGLLHVLRAISGSHSEIPRAYVVKPTDPALWTLLDEDKSRSQLPSRPVVFFSHFGSLKPEAFVEEAPLTGTAAEDTREGGVESIPEEEEMMSENVYTGPLRSRLGKGKENLGRTISPGSPFDWMGSGAYENLGSGSYDAQESPR